MKSDIDALMKARNMDAIMVVGNATHNPPMYYLTGGGHISAATLIKKCDQDAVLFCNDMEREEAARTGMKVIPLGTYPWQKMLAEVNGNVVKMSAQRLLMMLADCGLQEGTIGIYGQSDVSSAIAILNALQEVAPQFTFLGEPRESSLFMVAMETKDNQEVERIRKVGNTTISVVRRVQDFLTSRVVRQDEVLLDDDGSPVTIASVKTLIDLWLSESGAENPEGTIFAIGRDAGIPHSTGTGGDFLRLGQTIVFDIYPCEAGGGYFYDFTRTWCLGYASPEAQSLYDEVKRVYFKVQENLDLNAPFKDYQRLVCEEYQKNGHDTPLDTPSPLRGYVHSLGHGLGLNVHERPWSGLTSSDDNILRPGVVVTCEPGLYYPDKGMGVRIEDTLWVKPDGTMEILADYPYDFVLKMKHWKKS